MIIRVCSRSRGGLCVFLALVTRSEGPVSVNVTADSPCLYYGGIIVEDVRCLFFLGVFSTNYELIRGGVSLRRSQRRGVRLEMLI